MKTQPFNTVAIVGVGLIGGSLGLALRKRFPGMRIIGVDRPQVLRTALRRGAVNAASDLRRAVREADLVLIATPLRTILRLLPIIARNVGANTLVSDVGSVKGPILAKARGLFPAGNFVGGHPMAGIELTGIRAAHPLLFENAVYVVTPLTGRPNRQTRVLSSVIQAVGARTLVMDAQTHDAVAAAVSHLPQLVAVALMNIAGKQHRSSSRYLRLAAGGFRDLTRIASSSYDLWSHILPANRANTSEALELIIRELRGYQRALRANKQNPLRSSFSSARKLRNAIPRDMKGFLHTLAVVHVFVPDKPGMLARITTALSAKKINIKDIELMKVREGTGGTFRLSFSSREEASAAEKVLRKRGFETT